LCARTGLPRVEFEPGVSAWKGGDEETITPISILGPSNSSGSQPAAALAVVPVPVAAPAIRAGAAALPAHVTPGSSSSIRSRSSSGGGGRGGGEGRGAGSSTSDSGRAKKAAPEIACPDCSDTFPTAEALLRHLLYHYPGVAAEARLT